LPSRFVSAYTVYTRYKGPRADFWLILTSFRATTSVCVRTVRPLGTLMWERMRQARLAPNAPERAVLVDGNVAWPLRRRFGNQSNQLVSAQLLGLRSAVQ
jgi:hypothetical protein